MVAAALVVTALVALAELLAISVKNNAIAGSSTFTAALAVQKMEQLRGLKWGFDAQGNTTSDAALAPSTTDTLLESVVGYVDYLDVNGRVLGAGAAPPANAIYVRRWSIAPVETNPDNTLIIQVLVARIRGGVAPDTTLPSPEEARLVTVRTRKH